jgi:hypothetical protein
MRTDGLLDAPQEYQALARGGAGAVEVEIVADELAAPLPGRRRDDIAPGRDAATCGGPEREQRRRGGPAQPYRLRDGRAASAAFGLAGQ